MAFYLGIDFGTSGARAIAIDAGAEIQTIAHYPLDTQTPESWQTALFDLLEQIPVEIRREMKAIAIDGTSSTVLLCDRTGTPVAETILYNDARGSSVMDSLQTIAPPNHPAISATSSLAKLLWYARHDRIHHSAFHRVSTTGLFFLHQADWLSFLLHGQIGISDYHNALKLGYDPQVGFYPSWLLEGIAPLFQKVLPYLPHIVKPGSRIGEVTAEMGDRFELPPECYVCAGTTDSIAAFLASGAREPGEAVTSLGSTLVLKLLSRDRVDDARYGIYSHRLDPPALPARQGTLWLTGGASNTGGAVLRQFFTDTELTELSAQINPDRESPLQYYPLIFPGDRFPINNPNLPPRLDPRPDTPAEFLHGLLESIARIEARGYQLLQELGATTLKQVYTAGGGAKNPTWTAIRQRYLRVNVATSANTEAAYGTALLALKSDPQVRDPLSR
ncbi:FGGY-family carbohydrate kinase [Phormidium sp. CCY1219]|uniref:FGGY-family carbohydrate kinase n=1 Tax=Phormidium sp. CCY1219 TaxID=2886104 RepID=UPI002D1F89A0|nr:FGGY-family carbohydrate kinase [Phormidium sp. CCY1219]MEB3831071.1 FGGY-family carbohydrate kinase [Phormidium sp. CCY1219]